MEKLYEALQGATAYRSQILVAVLVVGIIVALILVVNAARNFYIILDDRKREIEKANNLRNVDYEAINPVKRASILRRIVSPDGVDPTPKSYLVINDGGEDIYLRSLTIEALPGTDKFANTFTDLLNFPNCTSSIFVQPQQESEMINKLDRHIVILDSEEYSADNSGDINRYRKIRNQKIDAERSAMELEAGDNKYFNVGFLFTLRADSIQALNHATSEFRKKALGKNISVSVCYAVQAESYLENAPLNGNVKIESKFVKSDAVKYFLMDKHAISAVYNYTTSSYSHKEGIALGRDMYTKSPILFDPYDPSHDGYTIVIAGMVGSGKSATIKMICSRLLPHDFHFVSVDSQARKGTNEGEYAAIAELADGVNFQISSSGDNIMNIFDVSESTKSVRDGETTYHERQTLDLTDKIAMVVNVLSNMVYSAAESKGDVALDLGIYINRVLSDNVAKLYKQFGIENDRPESLYTTKGSVLARPDATGSNRPPKRLPTMTDFYKQILISDRDNKEQDLVKAYSVVKHALKDYVRELYYTEKTITFLSREQLLKYQYSETLGGREYINEQKDKERVVEIEGSKPYYDGQSTVHVSKDVTFTNIDISQLPDSEKNLARQIAIDFVNENFIKKNSESLSSSDKLICIFDEAHENFRQEYARKTLDGVVRTARKRNVSVILSTQTVLEFDDYAETKAIFSQAAVKMIFKQNVKDKEYLETTLGLTPAQANKIVNELGGTVKNGEFDSSRRGEVCIIDNKRVCFCKVDYREATEALPVETDASRIAELFRAS